MNWLIISRITDSTLSFSSYVDFFSFLIRGFLFYFLIIRFGIIFQFVLAFESIFNVFLTILFNQANAILKSRQFQIKIYSHFRRAYFHAFKMFAMQNRDFSFIFLIIMAINTPLNSYLLRFILSVEQPSFEAILNPAFLLFAQYFVLFWQHYIFARYPKLIHFSGKKLASFYAQNQHRVGDFRTKNRLSLDICAIHNKKKYGYTYGAFGIITFASFTKVIFSKIKFFSNCKKNNYFPF